MYNYIDAGAASDGMKRRKGDPNQVGSTASRRGCLESQLARNRKFSAKNVLIVVSCTEPTWLFNCPSVNTRTVSRCSIWQRASSPLTQTPILSPMNKLFFGGCSP